MDIIPGIRLQVEVGLHWRIWVSAMVAYRISHGWEPEPLRQRWWKLESVVDASLPLIVCGKVDTRTLGVFRMAKLSNFMIQHCFSNCPHRP